MKLYEYKDYDDYIAHQKKWNALKLGKIVYVRKVTIDMICSDFGNAKNILCHGTRDGSEQRFFKENFNNAYILGSEIGDSAETFQMTVQHDFNKPVEEWLGKFDIVYSNSFDHSITPVECLKVWGDQLSEDGKIYLEYAESRSNVSESDPLGATNGEVEKFIKDSGLNLVKVISGGIKHGGCIFVCDKK